MGLSSEAEGGGAHGLVHYNDVRVPATNRLGAEGGASPWRKRA
jgi:hypothetical protein